MVNDMPHICGLVALPPQGSFIRLAEPYSHSSEERKPRLRVCIFDGEAVKSAFALLLTKVTKTSQRNLLSRAVSGIRYG